MKPPSTARTAGRSDWAERRFRRQPFILLSFSSSKKARKTRETQSYQRFQCIGHTDFNTSGTNGPRSLSRVKAGTHSAFGEGSHTAAHTAKQGPSLPRPQRGLVLPAISLLFHHAFIYIHFPVLCEPSTPAEENNPAKLPLQLCPNRFSSRFSTSRTNGPRLLSWAKAGTHSALLKGSHTAAHTPKQGRFGWGRYY